jgi:5-carboxymethyl-2-hydroxymuconate isomerase
VLRKKYNLSAYVNIVLRTIFGRKRREQQKTGESMMRKIQLYEQLFSIQSLLWSFSSRNMDFKLKLIENH